MFSPVQTGCSHSPIYHYINPPKKKKRRVVWVVCVYLIQIHPTQRVIQLFRSSIILLGKTDGLLIVVSRSSWCVIFLFLRFKVIGKNKMSSTQLRVENAPFFVWIAVINGWRPRRGKPTTNRISTRDTPKYPKVVSTVSTTNLNQPTLDWGNKELHDE